jgi:A/G-specific adenine glycosylase
VRRALLRWFARQARPFPWRTSPREPYAVLVAEIMLQQTQAARVALHYPRFLAAFPDVTRLAEADLHDVLLLWQGLGYYRRARALHAAARLIVERHGGRVPADASALARLPGVGRYTATAVAAQAFGTPGVPVDGNVRRVGARVLGVQPPPGARGDDLIERGLAERLLVGARRGQAAARVAEALIELGATVCTPRAPDCARCPLADACAAHASGRPTSFGAGPPRNAPRLEHARVVAALDDGRVAIVQRPPSGRWGGLWGFPDAPEGMQGDVLAPVEHTLTHRRLHVTAVVAGRDEAPPHATWIDLQALARGVSPVPIATLDRKLAVAIASARAAFAAAAEGAPADAAGIP